MLPTPAAWGGLLDSSTATLSRDTGPSLAVTLPSLAFPWHTLYCQAMMGAFRQGASLQSLPWTPLWDRHEPIPHTVEKSQLCPALL